MTIVLDASAAIEVALNKELVSDFRRALNDADLVLAPDTYPAEVTNVFWKYASHSGVPVVQCHAGIASCLNLVDAYVSTTTLCREVLAESVRTKHPAYDLFYLVAARRNGAGILSKDRRMLEVAGKLAIKIAHEL